MKHDFPSRLTGMHPYYTNGRYQCPKTGLMMPWYTRGACNYLSRLNLSKKSVFEFGVGYGTPWLKLMSGFYDGVDDNINWATAFNVQYYQSIDGYLKSIERARIYYDVVLVDGAFRKECIIKAIENVRPGGIIIADNWDQPSAEIDWGQTADLMKDRVATIFEEDNHPDWKTIVWQL